MSTLAKCFVARKQQHEHPVLIPAVHAMSSYVGQDELAQTDTAPCKSNNAAVIFEAMHHTDDSV